MNNSLDRLPWIEKYRPKDLSEVISHDSKIKVLTKLSESRAIPHLLLYGSPGSGKCLAKGTLVRMFCDGYVIKKVEDIKTGEMIMGDDFTPRKVLGTCQGRENMFRIKQSHGIDYEVNESHILSMKLIKNPTVKWERSSQKYVVWCDHLDGTSSPMRFNNSRSAHNYLKNLLDKGVNEDEKELNKNSWSC